MASTALLTHNAHIWNAPEGTFPDGLTDHNASGITDTFELLVTYDLSGLLASGNAFDTDGFEIFIAFAPGINEGEYFSPRGTSPQVGWFVIFDAGLPNGTTLPARMVNGGDLRKQFENRALIASDTIEVTKVNATQIGVKITSKHKADFGEFLRKAKYLNHEMFSLNHRLNPKLVDNSYESFYNREKAFGVHLYITKEKENIREENHFPFRVRFWNQDLDGNDSGTPMTVILTRDAVTVEGLSSSADTNVLLKFPKPAGFQAVLAEAISMVWKEEKGNSKVWYEDLEWSQKTVFTTGFPAQLDGLIWSPSVQLNLSAGFYEVEFTIRGEDVEEGAKYHFGILATMDTDPGGVFSHMQPIKGAPVTTDGIPEPCDLNVASTIMNYDKLWSISELRKGTPGDRYRLIVKLDKFAYEASCGVGSFWNDIVYFDLRIYEEGEDPESPLFQKVVFKNVDDEFSVAKKFEYLDTAGEFQISFDTRGGILNNQELIDASDKTLVYEWRFKFDYFGIPSYSTIYQYKQIIEFEEYDNLRSSPQREILSILYFNADTGLSITNFCDVSKVLVEVTLDAGHGSDGTNIHFRGFIDSSPYGTTPITDLALVEHDGYVSPEGFDQLGNLPIEYTDEFFDANGVAKMIINIDEIPLLSQRRILAIQQKGI